MFFGSVKGGMQLWPVLAYGFRFLPKLIYVFFLLFFVFQFLIFLLLFPCWIAEVLAFHRIPYFYIFLSALTGLAFCILFFAFLFFLVRRDVSYARKTMCEFNDPTLINYFFGIRLHLGQLYVGCLFVFPKKITFVSMEGQNRNIAKKHIYTDCITNTECKPPVITITHVLLINTKDEVCCFRVCVPVVVQPILSGLESLDSGTDSSEKPQDPPLDSSEQNE